jgi:hypothetical protein
MNFYDKKMRKRTICWLESLLETINAEEIDDSEEILNDLVDREEEIKYLMHILIDKVI